MKLIRLALLSALLVWPPLSGALANALGHSLAHHHCDNIWHGHDQGIVAAGDELPDCDRHVDGDLFSCHDCGLSFAAVPLDSAPLDRRAAPAPALAPDPISVARPVPSLFRPPIL